MPISASRLSRRSFLALSGAGAVGAATTTFAMPAWAVDATRPGAVRPPRLTGQDRQIINRIRPARAVDDLTYLTEVIGQRYTGTPGEDRAADYIAAQLDQAGYTVEVERFAVPDRRIGTLSGAGLDARFGWGVGSAAEAVQDVTVSGSLRLAPSSSPADLPVDLTGVVIMRVVTQTEDVTPLAVAAAERGAVAVIATRRDATAPSQAPAFVPRLTVPRVDIPVVGVSQVQKEQLLGLLRAGEARLTVTTMEYRDTRSSNVIGTRPGRKGAAGRTRDRVMVGAHYDSVIGSRGANDNGSGTALCLELARVMAASPTVADLSFGFWGSEEVGLVGSRHHARNLADAERARLRGVFNNDMIATSWEPAEKYWLLELNGRSNPVNQAVLAAGDRLGYRTKMGEIFPMGRSDHASFSEVGVDSGNFGWLHRDGFFLEPEYHSSDDTVARNISLERLTVSMEIQGCAAYALATS